MLYSTFSYKIKFITPSFRKKRKEAKLRWQGCRLYGSTRAWGGDKRSRT